VRVPSAPNTLLNVQSLVVTKPQRKRRKFHSPLCNCVFCVDFYETKQSTTDPTWECFCSECTSITSDEMDLTLKSSQKIQQFLRRANNCECTCGYCASCVTDTEFFFTVYRHKQRDEQCACPFCQSHQYHLTKYIL